MYAIELSPDEYAVLRDVLEVRQGGLRFELDHTDNRAFRDVLKRHLAVIQGLLARLPPPAQAARAAL